MSGLKDKRESAGLTEKELSAAVMEETGLILYTPAVYRYEKTGKGIGTGLLLAICSVLRCDMEEIYRGGSP